MPSPASHPSAGLVVNTSSVGMHGTRFEGLELDLLPAPGAGHRYRLCAAGDPALGRCQCAWAATVDGLGMLLHQAVPGFEAWFGVTPEVTPALRSRIEATLEH